MVKNSEYLCKCHVHRDTRYDEFRSQVTLQKEVLCAFPSHTGNNFEGMIFICSNMAFLPGQPPSLCYFLDFILV